MQYCPNCGAKNNASARFCAQCGYAMAAATPVGTMPPVVTPPPPPPSPALQAGALAPHTLLHTRYLILRLLGQGGMGAVYLASDRNAFDRRCVVKEMLPYYSNQAEKIKAEKDFEREARVLASMRFDGVPQVYEYFIEAGKYYLVMEFVEGENLEDRMNKAGGNLPMDEALSFGLQLANTLVYLAKQIPPVIHRDIKPANIILDQGQNKVKLVDFGLAKESVSNSMTGTLSAPLGTPGYAPMEQYTNQVESRTDVYALGATLHHLMTGRDPRAEAPFSFPPVRAYLPGVKPELEELIARMVATKVADRPPATEVRDVLELMVHPTMMQATSSGATPFAFRSGPAAYDAGELALLCDQHWDDGIYHLYSGHFEPWLDSINRHDLAVRAESIRIRGGAQPAGLEEFLRAANPTIPLPALAVDTRVLGLGQVEKGVAVNSRVQIKNVGRGCLHGRVVQKAGWVSVRPQDFSLMSNELADLSVSINSTSFQEGTFDGPAFEINSNGGQEVVNCLVDVTWQPSLVLEPKRRLNLGEVLQGQVQPVTSPLILRNTGGGVLQGRLTTDAPWLSFDTAEFSIPSGASATINITALPDDASLQMNTATIHVEMPAGVQELTATVGVRRPWFDRKTRLQTWALYGGLIALGYIGQVAPISILIWSLMSGQGMDWPAWAGLGLLFVASFAAFVFSRRFVARLDEIENYYSGQDLAASLWCSQFTGRKLAILTVVGAILGGTAGWRFSGLAAIPVWVWPVAGLLVGAGAGAFLAAVGAPSPSLPARWPWLAKLWRGATLDTSATFAAIRSGGLVVTGALFAGILCGSGYSPVQLAAVAFGACCGLVLSSESHRILASRLRWLLDMLRVATLSGLGAFLAIAWLLLLRFGVAWNLLPVYGTFMLAFPGLFPIAWELLLIIVGLVGALAGLWVADNLKLPRIVAWRYFNGLTIILLLISFPVFLLCGLLFHLFLPFEIANALVFVMTLLTIAFGVWALFLQRSHIESASVRARQALNAGVTQSRTLTQSAQGRIQKQLQTPGSFHTPNWISRIGLGIKAQTAKIKMPAQLSSMTAGFSLPSLAELETSAPIPLALAAAATAVVLQHWIGRLVVELAVGLGIVFVALLVVVAVLIGIRFGVLYLRQRRP